MPELPEVETIRRALAKQLIGRRIEKVRVRERRLRWPVETKRLTELTTARPISDIGRRAKYLLITLGENTLILHLGMSGRILFFTEPQPLEKHDHVIFTFENGDQMRFRDPRRFGMIDAIPTTEIARYPRFVRLGVEPLDRGTHAKKLFERASTLQRPIKNLVMDANFIVGVGNIYANEALFYAGIHPQTPARSLQSEDWKRLLGHIRAVLRKAIAKGGTTLNDFVDSDGEIGYFQLSLAVYGRAGQACPNCGSVIERFTQVGRSTFFCPNCQKETTLSKKPGAVPKRYL